jgi:hypothetical protein
VVAKWRVCRASLNSWIATTPLHGTDARALSFCLCVREVPHDGRGWAEHLFHGPGCAAFPGAPRLPMVVVVASLVLASSSWHDCVAWSADDAVVGRRRVRVVRRV